MSTNARVSYLPLRVRRRVFIVNTFVCLERELTQECGRAAQTSNERLASSRRLVFAAALGSSKRRTRPIHKFYCFISPNEACASTRALRMSKPLQPSKHARVYVRALTRPPARQFRRCAPRRRLETER